MERKDDFQQRRRHLAGLSDEELHQRFWELLDQVVEPLAELARTHTSPAIERSVLLRMGFSSLEAKALVEKCQEQGLLGKGAGHVVLKAAEISGRPYREAGLALIRGELWPQVTAEFARGGGR
ncbi:MAG: ornithine aminomutase [Firmicutes bacterium]|nr:ornithine aminomutase [Bacillota bacterium]HOB34553.1 ornithine aminomutase subunit alpha [Bacillota bacterium]HPZ91064.1 ornithine aminomutase subunit alpha [Bacillota bacterium]HQE01901.1 ornithine aminomutase subunit alpha [Bacillota bacterium]